MEYPCFFNLSITVSLPRKCPVNNFFFLNHDFVIFILLEFIQLLAHSLKIVINALNISKSMNINELHVLIVKGFIFFSIFKTTLSINHAIYVLVLELKIILYFQEMYFHKLQAVNCLIKFLKHTWIL